MTLPEEAIEAALLAVQPALDRKNARMRAVNSKLDEAKDQPGRAQDILALAAKEMNDVIKDLSMALIYNQPIIEAAAPHIHRGALEEAARDVCMYCGGRAPGLGSAEGPNSAGNYTHSREQPYGHDDVILCPATAIHARIRYERARIEEPSDG